jgi:hypothetical protein
LTLRRKWRRQAGIALAPTLWSASGQLEPTEFDAVGANVGKIVVRLLYQPASGTTSEDLGQSHGHLCRNPTLAIYQLRQSCARDSKRGGGIRYGQAQGFDTLA